MPDFQNFEENEEALFTDEKPATEFPTKAPILVPFHLQSEFMAWLDRYHPEIQGIYQLTFPMFSRLVSEFEHYRGRSSGYTSRQWWQSTHQS